MISFKNNVLGGIKVSENCRKGHNKELTQLFGGAGNIT
jgi:hypothetical protein